MPGPEKKIQKAVVRWAVREYGEIRNAKDEVVRPAKLLPRKFPAGRVNVNGYPDYDWLMIGGGIFFIEFKAPGKDCTPIQLNAHKKLRALGHRVYVCDNVDQGKRIVRTEMDKALRRAA